MTIAESIAEADALKPNACTDAQKIAWLNRLDGKIKGEIIDTHEDADDYTFDGYDTETAEDTVLLAPSPYDDIYPLYLQSQIDFANAEYARYNSTAAMFNAAYAQFVDYWNRAHLPLQNNYVAF